MKGACQFDVSFVAINSADSDGHVSGGTKALRDRLFGFSGKVRREFDLAGRPALPADQRNAAHDQRHDAAPDAQGGDPHQHRPRRDHRHRCAGSTRCARASSPAPASTRAALAVETAMLYLSRRAAAELRQQSGTGRASGSRMIQTFRAGRYPLRLHHRRRRQRRLHARQPADRVGPAFRAAARSRRQRQLDLVPHPGRLSLRHGQSARRLVLQHRAGARPQRPRAQLSARHA